MGEADDKRKKLNEQIQVQSVKLHWRLTSSTGMCRKIE